MAEDNTINTQKTIRRKVQVVGGNTITVSLPRTWADRNRLGREAGQESEVAMRHMADGSLLLSPANSAGQHVDRRRTHKLAADVNIEAIKRSIIGDYLGGIDIIRFYFKTKLDIDMVHDIRKFVERRLIGFDLIETGDGFDVINMAGGGLTFSVDRLLEIIRVQSSQMMEKCITWLKDDSIDRHELTRELDLLEGSLDKRANQLIRTLQLSILDYWVAEGVNLNLAEILYWSRVTRAAENASDLSVAIAEVSQIIDLNKIPDHILQQIYDLGEKAIQLFSTALNAFIKHRYDDALTVLEEADLLSTTNQRKWPVDQISSLEGPMILVIRHLEKISVYARKVAEAVIDGDAARAAYAAGQD